MISAGHRGQRVRVKICGITLPEDARKAAELGVDAIGLVFTGASPRKVTPEAGLTICDGLPPFVCRVGLFMDTDADEVRSVLDQVPLDWLQFHGSESEEYCHSFGRPYIKALGMAGGQSDFDIFPSAAALLVDSHAPGQAGGTGKTFDWDRLQAPRRPWILAGGLKPENVVRAINQLHPPGVDVSSGVEASPGIKDHGRMKEFMEAIERG